MLGMLNVIGVLKRIGSNIRTERERVGLSQGELAKRLKVDRSYVSTLEKGTRNPTLKSVLLLADALGVSPVALIEPSAYASNTRAATPMPYVRGIMDAKIEEWKGHEWYHQRFDGAPYLIHMIAEAQIHTRRDAKHGLFFDRHFCFYEDGKADWYMDMAEVERITKRVLEFRASDPDFGRTLMREYQAFDDRFYALCADIEHTDVRRLDDTELMQLHDGYVEAILDRNSSSSIIDGFALGSDRMLEARIRTAYDASSVSTAHTFAEVFSSLTTPAHSSFIRDAELELFRLIRDIVTKRGDKRTLIKEYRDKYFWIRNNYVDANVLTVPYFEDEIARIRSSGLDIDAEISRLERMPEEAATAKHSFIKKLKLDAETLYLLEMTAAFTQWQDERKKATMFTAHYATLLLEEIGRRVGLSADLLKYLSPREVSRVFKDTPPAAVLEERRRGCVGYWDADGHEIVSGARPEQVRKALLGSRDFGDVQDFRGMTASLGKAQGVVRILRSAKEVDKVKPGDVLVAVMTRPDYVPAMKRAAAIVTDEGGITSHAAIVSRELRIPCVIGTKIATQVLRDGDVVEVSANHGLVRVLQRQQG
jgi:phosphohistidine swiveling domain-containing protein/transcriptional regulator with XRE-family HTH domain